MAKRVTESWGPEYAIIYINKKSDRRLFFEALVSGMENGSEIVTDVVKRRFPEILDRTSDVRNLNVGIHSYELKTIVAAIAIYASEHSNDNRQRRRAERLAGALIIAAPNTFSFVRESY